MATTNDSDANVTEAEVSIIPIAEKLAGLGITVEEFEAGLPAALDAFHDKIEGLSDVDAIPTLDEVEIQIRGVNFLLGEVAEINISGDLD
jgi:hypothetical protein